MSKESPIFIRPNFPRSTAFHLECDSPESCRLGWRYPLLDGLWISAAVFAVIASVFFTMAIATVLEIPYPLRILGAIFFAIPAVTIFVLRTSFLLDDRSESLTLYADRIEHEAPSTMTHYLFRIVDEWRYEYANMAFGGFDYRRIAGMRDWFGRPVPCSIPVINRCEIERLKYDEFGECPECIVMCPDKAFCVGHYLHTHELRPVARAIQAWLHGQSPSQVYQAVLARFDHSRAADGMNRVQCNEAVWNELLDSPPRGYRVELPGGDGAVVVIRFRGTMIRLEADKLCCDRPLYLTGRHDNVLIIALI